MVAIVLFSYFFNFFIFFFTIQTQQKTLELKQYFGSHRGTDIPSGHTMCNSSKVKKSTLKNLQSTRSSKAQFLP